MPHLIFRRAIPILILTLFLLTPLAGATVQAQAPNDTFYAPNSSVHFTNLSMEQGLSEYFVQAIVQDKQGFIWLGTENGLNRYDGYNFVVYKNDPKNPTSLANSFVYTLFVDNMNRLSEVTIAQ